MCIVEKGHKTNDGKRGEYNKKIMGMKEYSFRV